jgi:hypothetical protein
MTIETIEAYSQITTETRTYTDATPTSTGTRAETSSFGASVTVTKDKILIPETIDATNPPALYAYRRHASATAYGDGLYDAHGLIVIVAPTHRIDAVDYTGDWIGTDISSTADGSEQYVFRYESDATALNGLATPARVVATQQLHGPAIAYRANVVLVDDQPGGIDDEFILTDIPFLPLETNPDGETYDALGNPQTELFFTDTFLSSLVFGTFIGTMIRTTGSASRTEPNYNDTDPQAALAWSHSWSRSGTLTLTLLP